MCVGVFPPLTPPSNVHIYFINIYKYIYRFSNPKPVDAERVDMDSKPCCWQVARLKRLGVRELKWGRGGGAPY